MKNEVLEELWKIKDQIAEENGYDMDKLAAQVKEQERSATAEVVNLSASRKTD
jgi:predicted DNA-binding ribbon-helix-helix protein